MNRADTRLSASGRSPAAGGSGARAGLRPRVVVYAVLALAIATVAAGCSVFSPATVVTPYEPSDGVNVDLSDDLYLRNVLVVAAEKGGEGAVVAAIVNEGNRPATVQLAAQLGETAPFGQTRVNVPANGRVLVAPGERNEMVIPDLPVGPGELVEMSAAAPAAGTQYFEAPVVTPEGPYASLTVAPTTPAATPTGTPAATESDPSGGTGVGQSSAVPTDSESATPTP